MKTGIFVSTAISLTLITTSHQVAASTLHPHADSVVKRERSVFGFSSESWLPVEHNMKLDSAAKRRDDFMKPLQGTGKGELMKALHSATHRPVYDLVLPETVPAIQRKNHGMPAQVPPVNPPWDTPAFYYGLVHAPTMMPAVVPSHTLPGSGFGQNQVVVPVPAAAWLFCSGLLALLSVLRYRRQ